MHTIFSHKIQYLKEGCRRTFNFHFLHEQNPARQAGEPVYHGSRVFKLGGAGFTQRSDSAGPCTTRSQNLYATGSYFSSKFKRSATQFLTWFLSRDSGRFG